MEKRTDTLRIKFNKPVKAKARLTVHGFIDHDHHIAYLPALNLTAYGDTPQEAVDRLLGEVLDDFLENLIALGPIEANKILVKLGWHQEALFKKRFVSEAYVDIDGVLKDFNLPQETKVATTVLSV